MQDDPLPPEHAARIDGVQERGLGRLESGGSIPGLSRPAFTLQHPEKTLLPVLIAVPHAGRAYPPGIVERMREPARTPLRLEDRHVDAVGREAAAMCGVPLLVAHAPRAMIDLNRDPNDLDLGMFTASEGEKAAMRRRLPAGGSQMARSLRGLGLFPRRISGLGELWRTPMLPVEASGRVAAIHAPYHEKLAETLDSIRAQWGTALLIDLHSMPDLPARSAGAAAPTHVIGDRFGASCARSAVDAALSTLEIAGAEGAYNRPYAGGFVLERHANPRRSIHAVQVELARSLYLDEKGEVPGKGVADQSLVIASIARAMADVVISCGGTWGMAAE